MFRQLTRDTVNGTNANLFQSSKQVFSNVYGLTKLPCVNIRSHCERKSIAVKYIDQACRLD